MKPARPPAKTPRSAVLPAAKAKAGTTVPAKAATPANTAVRPAGKASPPRAPADPPTTDGTQAPKAAVATLRKKELIDRVAADTGAKKKAVRAIVEATLGHLGAAIGRGQDLNLPPFGKARVNRTRDIEGGTALMLKVRQSVSKDDKAAPGSAAKAGLAKADDTR